MVASAIPGRIRVRANHLTDQRLLSQAKKAIYRLEGIKDIRTNQGAGSLTVYYDINEMSEWEMEDRVESICQSGSSRRVSQKNNSQMGKITKIGMVATLIPTVAYAVAGKKKYHIYAGTAFVCFAALHMGRYSDRLFR